MRETILEVLEEWSDLQPNIESASCRELLTRDLYDAIMEHLNVELAKAESNTND